MPSPVIGRRPGLAHRALPALLTALCLLAPAASQAADPLPPLAYAIEAGARLLVPFEDDIKDVYGVLPIAQLRLGIRPSARLVYLVGLGYGRARGDLWDDDPTFSGGAQAELDVVPLEMGVRWDGAGRPDFRLNVGVTFELAWVRETMPGGDAFDLDQPLRETGWLRGVNLSLGPEWLSGDGRRSFGFETGLAGSGGTIGGRYGREVNLAGAWFRAYVTLRI